MLEPSGYLPPVGAVADWRDRAETGVMVARGEQFTLCFNRVTVKGLLPVSATRVEVLVAHVAVFLVAPPIAVDIMEVVNCLTSTQPR